MYNISNYKTTYVLEKCLLFISKNILFDKRNYIYSTKNYNIRKCGRQRAKEFTTWSITNEKSRRRKHRGVGEVWDTEKQGARDKALRTQRTPLIWPWI